MGIVEQYLLQLKSEKRRWRRAAAILTVLSLLVATGVSWNLRMTGVTIANGATCGQVEHQHTEECPMLKTLICGYDDEIATEAPADVPNEELVDVPTEEAVGVPTEEAVTLPFCSYGGSSIITLFAAMGIISSVKARALPSWLRDRSKV